MTLIHTSTLNIERYGLQYKGGMSQKLFRLIFLKLEFMCKPHSVRRGKARLYFTREHVSVSYKYKLQPSPSSPLKSLLSTPAPPVAARAPLPPPPPPAAGLTNTQTEEDIFCSSRWFFSCWVTLQAD